MKKIFNIYAIVLMLPVIIGVSSCEKKYDGTYDRYDPVPITLENVNLKYEPVSSYPIPDTKINSKKPTWEAEGPVDFGIDTTYALNGTKYQTGKFKIDRSTGVVTYDNKGGTIEPGVYTVSISILNTTGYAIVDSVYRLTILDVPVEVTADPASPEVEYLYTGEVSKLTYSPVGIPEDSLGKVKYSISPSVNGFEIDGKKILKTVDATPGVHKLNIVAATDLGEKEFKNLVQVTVGEKPTLKYVQQNGTDSLGKVTLSPWAAYTTADPVLTGMTAEEWKVILPDGAPQELKDALTVDQTTGAVMVAAGMNIPDGDYLIGVKVSYSGEWVAFKDLFVISIKTTWKEIILPNDTLDNKTYDVTKFVKNEGSERGFTYVAVDPPENSHIKLGMKKDAFLDTYFTTKVTMPSDFDGNAIKVAFNESLVNSKVENYAVVQRKVECSSDNSAWTEVLAPGDASWQHDITGEYLMTSDFASLDNSQPYFYFKWHYTSDNMAASGEFQINDIAFSYSVDTEPIEE